MVAQEGNIPQEASKAYFHLGFAYFNLGAWREAIENFEKELLLIAGQGEGQKEICQSYTRIGDIYFRLKEWRKALDFYQRSLIIAKSWHDKEAENKASIGIAKTYYELKEATKATRFYQVLSGSTRQGRFEGEIVHNMD